MTVPDPGLLDEAAETTTHTEPVGLTSRDALIADAVADRLQNVARERLGRTLTHDEALILANEAVARVRLFDNDR